MRCRVVNVIIEMQLDLQHTSQTKNERWNENLEEISRRHPEINEPIDVGIDSGHYNLCLELLGLWADVVYSKFGAMVDMHDIMQMEMLLAAAFLSGKDTVASDMFLTLMQQPGDEDGCASPD